jgi:ABC-type multidrug transport system permease subunit
MLNEERIILMTKMASYEEHEGKKNMAIGRYFRGDYIAVQVIKAVIAATISFGVLFGLFIFYDFEVFMQDIYKMDLITYARNALFIYVGMVVLYSAVCYGVCMYRYSKAKKSLKLYYYNLKKLNSLYNQ